MDTFINIENTQLVYVAEGNANIVLKLPDYNHVLRLPKTEIEMSSETNTVYEYLSKCRKYMKIIMQAVGEKYIYLPFPIEIPENVVMNLNASTTSLRPKGRLNKNFTGKYGLLMLDATVGIATEDTYSVEIKPKQGWAFDDSVNHFFNITSLKNCRYCCMQYLKVKQGKISTRSKYCPMDLFSGNLQRMHMAFDALLEEPQNNLRIFKNGELIYGDCDLNKDGIESLFNDLGKSDFYKLLSECLLGITIPVNDSSNLPREQFIPCNPQTNLPVSSILKKVFDLQNLAKVNIPYMCKLRYRNDKTYNALNSLVLKADFDWRKLSPEEQYMIGATLMDASFMITIHRYNEDTSSAFGDIRVANGKRYFTKVTLLDLDPKPDNHYLKYVKQTNEAFKAAEEYLACMDKSISPEEFVTQERTGII